MNVPRTTSENHALLDVLGLPDYPHVVFARTPIALALFQVRFPPALDTGSSTLIDSFQRAIHDRYPITSKQGQVAVEIAVGPEGHDIRERKTDLWRFAEPNDNWTVVLTSEFLTLETRAYQHFNEFLERLAEALAALTSTIGPEGISRLGLRYINEIRVDPKELDHAIQRGLLGPLATPSIRSHAVQSTQQVVLQYSGGERITITHGLIPTGTTVQVNASQEPPTTPFYLLDFDASRELPPTDGSKIDTRFILEQAQLYNKAIYRLFRWSVTDEYVAWLGVKNDER